jgi:hypothetical protein
MQTRSTTVIDKPVEADETNRLISSEKVDGTAVYNSAGDHLGAVHHLMVDKFTVMSNTPLCRSAVSLAWVKAITHCRGKP